ncbi:MAG TPA: toll/interleukin-1 receptor domain-containing protein, partial [Streptosporangiaceae bacterium]|nr:toll/interleukin-1 receptor domain-containing protein [Streptosporangiaceae bacterium]
MAPNEPSSFFVSYSHADLEYTTRFAQHLRSADLPVWFDRDLAWGVRFPTEIPQQIMYALAVIVLMSPTAEASEWVEREILEGQRYDRQFLPVLVDGERFFLLASSYYFDARDGALPGERELCQLRAIRDRDRAGGGGPAPEIRLAPPVRASASTRPKTGASFTKLRSFLGAGELTSADILTTAMILQAVGRHGDGWLRLEDGARVPSELLTGIDTTWARFTHGAHGFRAQLSCRRIGPGGAGREVGAPDLGGRDLSVRDDFASLAMALGWCRAGRGVQRYGEFVEGERPVGFFPTLRNPQSERHHTWHDRWVRTVLA